VSLVGYTNAGKSTLLNALTGADAFTEDRLFATLDTTTRAWAVEGGRKVFLSDTVGFIRGLPHHLVESFHATLEEAREADLLLHVVDAANPDADAQLAAVGEVLSEIGAAGIPSIIVLNKLDALKDRMALQVARPRNGRSVAISARTGEGLAELEQAVVLEIEERQVEMTLLLDPGDGKGLAFLSEKGTVLSRDYDEPGVVRVVARLPRRYASALPDGVREG
jgi:GTP-binding protein HflX